MLKIFLIVFLFSHLTLANTCFDHLSSKWHIVSEHFTANSTQRAALRRFGIQGILGDKVSGLSAREQVSEYFKQIDQRYSLALIEKATFEELKTEWLNRALIREVPQSYIDHQRTIARQNGEQSDFDRAFNQNAALNLLQEQQKESFLRWFDYVMGPDIEVAPWLRYILLEELLGIGIYNPNSNKFSERTMETTGPYPSLNSEAFGRVYQVLDAYYGGRHAEIEPYLLAMIQNDERRAFANIYALRLEQLDQLGKNFDLNVTQGRWTKYTKGDSNHALELFNSLQGQNTGWCTADSCRTANTQVEGGDFYVYYSDDFNGESTVPRIAIRMVDDQIKEIRGRAKDQNPDSQIADTNILEVKLKEFGIEGEKYKTRVEHMRRLTVMDKKHRNNEFLSLDDLRFLYEIDEKIQGFGYSQDPRIAEIISERNVRADISHVLNIHYDQVSLTNAEALSGGTIYHRGDLELPSRANAEGLALPQYVSGDVNLRSLTTAEGLILPRHIGGGLYLNSLSNAEGLALPQYVGGILKLASLARAEGLSLPQYVGKDIDLHSLSTAEDVTFPQQVGGGIYLNSLSNADSLTLPLHIGGDLNLKSLNNAKDLIFPKHMVGQLNLSSLTSSESLSLPQYVGGSLHLDRLARAKDLTLPQHVGGDLYLSLLASMDGLALPQYVGGHLNLRSLTSEKSLNLPRHVGGHILLNPRTATGDLIQPQFHGGEYVGPSF